MSNDIRAPLPYTEEEVMQQKWFGGQLERVLATVKALQAAEATLQRTADTSTRVVHTPAYTADTPILEAAAELAPTSKCK